MKSFIYTGKQGNIDILPYLNRIIVQEIDNGRTWFMNFYFKGQLIDQINLEILRGTEIFEPIKNLKVYDENEQYIGTVKERLENAFQVHYDEMLLSSFEAQYC